MQNANQDLFKDSSINDAVRKIVDATSDPLSVPAAINVDRNIRNATHALAVVNSMTIKEYITHLIANDINHLDSDKYRNYHMVKYYLDERYTNKF